MDNSRHKANSGRRYSLYFDLLRDKIDQYQVEARHVYNIDEKGFMLRVVGRSKRIFSKASYEARKRRSIIQDSSREWIMLLACICADGSYLEPALIYRSTSRSMQDSWLKAQNKISKLNQTIHRLSVRATLAEHKNKGLWEATVSERMRRKRGKPLLLKEPEEYHSGAVFWSPRKVKEARDRQQLKEREEEQLQYQKAEANRRRKEVRQAKAKAVQARRQAKVEARISTEKEKADRAAKQASRAAARRTHQ
jgi:hypothetical protein